MAPLKTSKNTGATLDAGAPASTTTTDTMDCWGVDLRIPFPVDDARRALASQAQFSPALSDQPLDKLPVFDESSGSGPINLADPQVVAAEGKMDFKTAAWLAESAVKCEQLMANQDSLRTNTEFYLEVPPLPFEPRESWEIAFRAVISPIEHRLGQDAASINDPAFWQKTYFDLTKQHSAQLLELGIFNVLALQEEVIGRELWRQGVSCSSPYEDLRDLSPMLYITALNRSLIDRDIAQSAISDMPRWLQDTSSTRQLALKLAEVAPVSMLEHYGSYSSMPWASDAARTAAFAASQQGSPDLEQTLRKLQREVPAEQFAGIRSAATQDNSEARAVESLICGTVNQNRQALLADPALCNFDLIQDSWLTGCPGARAMGAESREELKACIARNLHFSGTEVNKSSVQEEGSRILEIRKELEDFALFRERKVFLLGDPEKREGKGWNRFCTPQLVKDLQEESGALGSFKFYQPTHDHPVFSELARDRALEAISETSLPITLVFDGHGTPASLSLGERGAFISPEKLGEALLKNGNRRLSACPTCEESPSVVILAACQSSEFARRLYDFMGDKGPLPIVIAATEYGQNGMTEYLSRYHNDIFDLVLRIGEKEHTPTLGDVLERQRRDDNNVCVFVPGPNGKPRQII